jgi:nucleoside-diphosphate-sugar epimerase
VLLIGAGEAGVMVARELAGRPDLGLDAVGFLDDDKRKVGTHIGGLPVLGTSDQLVEEIAQRKRAKRALITIASATWRSRTSSGASRWRSTRRIVAAHRCAAAPVLVTGAGGSIGSELCRQVARYEPCAAGAGRAAENALFEIHRELRQRFPELSPSCRASPTSPTGAHAGALREHRPDAGVPRRGAQARADDGVEPGEAIKNNVFGTRTWPTSRTPHGVEQFVMISTDKAVNPTSVMGATKRVAEIYVQALSQRRTRFVTVRFGNVLGSRRQRGAHLQGADREGRPGDRHAPGDEAVLHDHPRGLQLVLQAGAMGAGGEIFVLDMGEPVKIVDLAATSSACRAAPGRGHRDRVHRHAPRREAVRGAGDRQEQPTRPAPQDLRGPPGTAALHLALRCSASAPATRCGCDAHLRRQRQPRLPTSARPRCSSIATEATWNLDPALLARRSTTAAARGLLPRR